MSRFLYWTIVIGAEPTAFRAREAADLQPTLGQLRRTRPDATLKWFQGGRLWASPEEARAALDEERRAARSRPPTWRPGGKHEDPRQKYKDAKKAKWTRFKEAVRRRAETRADSRPPSDPSSGQRPPRPDGPRGSASRPPWRPPSSQSSPRPASDRPPSSRPRSQSPGEDAPPSSRPASARPRSSRPPSSRPVTPRPPASRSGRPPGQPFGKAPRAPLPQRGPRGPRGRKGPGR